MLNLLRIFQSLQFQKVTRLVFSQLMQVCLSNIVTIICLNIFHSIGEMSGHTGLNPRERHMMKPTQFFLYHKMDGQYLTTSSDKETRTFYNLDIQHSYKHSEFITLAGRFDDLMVVTVPSRDKFWFKDVYAKGVGLIYYENKSQKGL